jgi:hypothetical protein
MTERDQEAEYKAEAERLRLLDLQTQQDIVGMHRNLSRSPKLSAKERQAAKERAQALTRLLGLFRRRRSV